MSSETLRQRLDRERQLPIDEAIEIARRVAFELEDYRSSGQGPPLSPEAITISDGGRVEVSLSETGSSIESMSRDDDGELVGTPDYTAPELISGVGAVSAQARQYALGCILYEMLAGHPPFQAASPQAVLARHVNDPIPPLVSVRPGVSPALEAVIFRALSKLPADRFRSHADFANALEMAGQGVTPRGVTPAGMTIGTVGEGASARVRRVPATWLALAALGAVVIGYAAYRLTGESGASASASPLDFLPRPLPEARQPVDRCAWGIAPFRIIGDDSEIGGLASGLPVTLDGILNPSMSGSGVLSTPSGAVEQARHEALERGFSRVMTGSIVGGDGTITVQTETRMTRNGRRVASETVEGPADSLQSLALRLALQSSMMTVDASTRLVIRETAPEAVAATVDGMVALCAARLGGGDTQWIEGARRLETALEIDSTFAVAAFLLSNAAFFHPERNVQYDLYSPRLQALRFRHRLPAADRLYLELGREDETRYVRPAIDRIREAVARFPHSHWLWRPLQGHLYYRGEYAGVEGWEQEVLAAFRHVAELEDHEGGVNCQEVWVLARLDGVPDEQWDDYAHCAEFGTPLDRAVWVRDSAEIRRLRAEGATLDAGAFGLRWFGVQLGLDLTDWEPALERQREAARTFNDQLVWAHERYAYERISGRPRAAARFADSVAALTASVDYPELQMHTTPWYLLTRAMETAAFEPGPAPYLSVLDERLYSFADTAVYDPQAGWNSTYDRLCLPELARVAQGDTLRTVANLQAMRVWRDGADDNELRFCPEMISAGLERARFGARYPRVARGDLPELTRLDSIFSLAPTGDSNDITAPLILARLYWARADTAKAYDWVRRRIVGRHTTYNMAPWLRSDGRISLAAGDLDRARKMYRHFLLLRRDPEPGAPTAQRDSVVAELACIDDEFIDTRDPAFCRALLGDG
ncbi:MAG: hypothetical protein R3195_15545 [Gemmatimonadota bacterium]|nr:hypothetical protein [Gemmatimonadota bacterium]